MNAAEYVGWVVIFLSTAIVVFALLGLATERAWSLLRKRRGWAEIKEAIRFYDEHKQETPADQLGGNGD